MIRKHVGERDEQVFHQISGTVTMSDQWFCVTTSLVLLCLGVLTTALCDTPQLLSNFSDVTKALYHGSPVRYQVNNATACAQTSGFTAKLYNNNMASDAHTSGFTAKLYNNNMASDVHPSGFLSKHKSMANDVNVALKTSTGEQEIDFIITWNEKIADGRIFNTTGPVLLLTETSIYENGNLVVNLTVWNARSSNIVYLESLRCRWGKDGGNTSEAAIYKQDKSGVEIKDFNALHQALLSGYSMAFVLDLSLMSPPGQEHVIGRIKYINFNEKLLQFHEHWCNRTHKTDFLIQTTPDKVTVTQLIYEVMSDQIVSQIVRQGPFGANHCINFIRLPYDA